MSERLIPDNPDEKPVRNSPEELVKEYLEVKQLLEWLVGADKNADPVLWSKRHYRLNQLLMKHDLLTEDMYEGIQIFKKHAENTGLLPKPSK